ncbi:MAG: response regulator transcription factor [Dehalococcoidia bacterium]|jgi:DNA-binding response OmpR family regulator
MWRVLVIAQESESVSGLRSEIARNGLACSIVSHGDGLEEEIVAYRPDLVLVEVQDDFTTARTLGLIGEFKEKKRLPLIALVGREALDDFDAIDADDFLLSPYDGRELALRVKRQLNIVQNGASGELIRCDGLLIDLARCEVTLEGRIIELTFKEYELLKLLAVNSGRVYSREALLDQVWGYDYYGGDRTVDVHVRRLRSKIEDATHTFIETVRNVGYRFKKSR